MHVYSTDVDVNDGIKLYIEKNKRLLELWNSFQMYIATDATTPQLKKLYQRQQK
jgi:hypothetical protein